MAKTKKTFTHKKLVIRELYKMYLCPQYRRFGNQITTFSFHLQISKFKKKPRILKFCSIFNNSYREIDKNKHDIQKT